MTTRILIAAALMASACVAQADVLPAAGIVDGSKVAGATGNASVIAGVTRGQGSDAMVQALYDKINAQVGSDMKVSMQQGVNGVYLTGLTAAQALALADDGVSAIKTDQGYLFTNAPNGSGTTGGGASTGNNGSSGSTSGGTSGSSSGGSTGGSSGGTTGGSDNGTQGGNANGNPGVGNGSGDGKTSNPGIGDGAGAGKDNNPGGGIGGGANGNPGVGNNDQVTPSADVPEPSSIALMLAGMLGVAGLRRRRAR